jgi:hypothetical protein
MIRTEKWFNCGDCGEDTSKNFQNFTCHLRLCGACYYRFKIEKSGSEKIFFLLMEKTNPYLVQTKEAILRFITSAREYLFEKEAIIENLSEFFREEFESLSHSGKARYLKDLEVLTPEITSADFMQAIETADLAEMLWEFWLAEDKE